MFSSLTRVVNAKWFIRTRHWSRLAFVSACILAGFLLIAVCCFHGDRVAAFYFSLVASVVVGVGCALGESTMLGFLKAFPGDAIGYYSSGTGFAGIFGSLALLALAACGLSHGAVYLVAAPTALPYILVFSWLDRMKQRHPYLAEPALGPESAETSLL